MKKYLLSCDWGTTAFRLRLIETKNQKVISEVVTLEGIARTYAAWKETGLDKEAFYKTPLKKQIAVLASQSKTALDGFDIALSGMASASIGILELPYATLPFGLDGQNAFIQTIEAEDNFPHKIFLISGVRSEDDVMRGEETQLVGLMGLLNLNTKYTEGGYIFILPGTHSKHIYILNNQLMGIQTFMTGELFNIVAQNSILKDSIDLTDLHVFTHQDVAAFKAGVLEAASTDLMKSLFKVRTNQLFDKLTKKENGFYLSGLLIGAELKGLRTEKNETLVLCCGNNLFEFYQSAINILGFSERTIIVPSDMIDKAVVAGQIRILRL